MKLFLLSLTFKNIIVPRYWLSSGGFFNGFCVTFVGIYIGGCNSRKMVCYYIRDTSNEEDKDRNGGKDYGSWMGLFDFYCGDTFIWCQQL